MRERPARRSPSGHRAWSACLFAAAALALPRESPAQNYRARLLRPEDPQWLKIRISQMELGAYAEKLTEKTTYEGSDRSTTFESSLLAPTLSLSMMGSVYHPNFLRFSIASEGGYGWGTQRTKSTTTDRKDHIHYFGMFRGNAVLLAGKPVSGQLYSTYGRTHREYDFFTRATVDALTYGGRVTYQSPSVYIGSQYTRTDEHVSDASSSYDSAQDLFNFDANRYRLAGSTAFNYSFSQSRFSDQGSPDGTRMHSVALADNERLGSREQADLQSGVTYTHEESATDPSDQATGHASLGLDHTPDLSSYYTASYDHFETGDFISDSAGGSAGLSHQLYESLNSSVTADGSTSHSSDDTGSGYTRQYGATWNEGYRKRLGARHRLRLDNTLSVSHTDQKTGGRVVNERHSFPAPPQSESFVLGRAGVIESSIVVSDENNLRLFVRGIDYEIFPSGSRLEIRRIPGGRITQGGTVLVDYDATPGGRGGYETVGERCGIRLDLWEDLWGIYGRYQITRNNAPAELSALDQTRYTYGTDVSWEWFRAGAEREIYDSEGSAYEANRLFEAFSFTPDPLSAFSLDLSQTFTTFRDTDRYERDYRFLTNYRRQLTRNLNASASAGLDLRSGEGVDQTLVVFRPVIHYVYGLTSIELTYDREYDDYLRQEKRNKQQFTVTLKRSF